MASPFVPMDGRLTNRAKSKPQNRQTAAPAWMVSAHDGHTFVPAWPAPVPGGGGGGGWSTSDQENRSGGGGISLTGCLSRARPAAP